MAAKQELNIPQLFTDVTKNFRDGDFVQAQKICNKILKAFPNDIDAIKCKIVCLIQQSFFQEAHDVIVSAEKKQLLSMPFEKSYCLYRLNRLQEAKLILSGIGNLGLKEKELLAQVEYRLESYSSCLDLYINVIKNSADEFGNEREANMAAVIAASKMWKNEDLGHSQIRLDTYELCYNYGCLLIAQGNLNKAEQVLKNAEAICRKSLEADEEITEEEIEEDLGVIRAQLGYIYQLEGKTTEALSAYNSVMKGKQTDMTLSAVVSNNIISIHKERDLFDSKKRLKSVSCDDLQNKLTKCQLRTLEITKCLLYMHTNQMDKCRKCIEQLKTTLALPGYEDKTVLLEAAIFLKDKNLEQAHEHLKSALFSGLKSNDIILTLAQLYLSKGKTEEALNVLQELKEIKFSPAVVSLCVGLYCSIGNRKKAIEYLDEAVKFGKQNQNILKKVHLLAFMRENSNLKLADGDIKSAVEILEDLRKEDPGEVSTLAKIVAAYSKIDLKRAKQYSVDLPDLPQRKDISVDTLEMTDQIGSFRFSKKTVKPTLEEGEVKDEVSIKRKRRKRKKGKLPKNYDPEIDPDPERWLPKWERSTFKHKKAKKGANTVGKGTQGSVAPDQPVSPKANPVSSPKVSSPKPGSSSSVVPPRQQKPSAKSGKGKKKKGKGW
ncbi:signal recognition particle subunit SRP72 isoform X1 [Hydra vulgaris]|uniref:signal recognition particle subunit SRP72 isoform X1 n=1 Tax=Hydra vulgaris TaxID=6087 RepID=UPI001F5EF598|nr:signal recognition particle subunit SRP72 [Hydra vulgaris]